MFKIVWSVMLPAFNGGMMGSRITSHLLKKCFLRVWCVAIWQKFCKKNTLANLPSRSTVRNDFSIKRLKPCGKSEYDLPTHTLWSAVLYSSTLTSWSCFHTEGVIKKAYRSALWAGAKVFDDVQWVLWLGNGKYHFLSNFSVSILTVSVL